MKKFKRYVVLNMVFFCTVNCIYSQQKISDKSVNENSFTSREAILELSSDSKGLLNTRVALVESQKSAPFEKHTAGMMIYNTSKINDVVPGIYYSDGTRWVLARAEAAANITYDPSTLSLSFRNAQNQPQTISLKGKETITSLVNNNNGSFTYTAEDGTQTTFTEMSKSTGKITSNELTVKSSEGAVLKDIQLGLKDHSISIDKIVKGKENKILTTDSDGLPIWSSGAIPKFFYMPSIVIPTSEAQFVKEIDGESFGTINLYQRYLNQFSKPLVKSKNAPALPTIAETDLFYYITWYDSTVFNSVTVSETGVLKYSVKLDADLSTGSFMNIVFALK